MNVLVIAPHPDDEAIGCGGALRLHVERGDRVIVVFLTSGELGIKGLEKEAVWRIREPEAVAAGTILGVADLVFLRRPDYALGECVHETARDLSPVLAREAPDVVYLPHPQEWHPDHRAAEPILRRALTGASHPTRARLYEVWTPMAGHDDGEDISSVMRRKLQAVRAHASQVQQLRYDRAVRGLNQYRGALAWGCRYAEVFRTVDLGASLT